MYDEVAQLYHLIFEDWDQSIARHADQLTQIIQDVWGHDCRQLLDLTCGIGTQSIGLAQRGFAVTASDLSTSLVSRARAEAARRDVSVEFSVCDILEAAEHHGTGFDVTISCDNALAHMLSDDQILNALRQMFQCTRGGGGSLITLRDHDDPGFREHKLESYGVRTYQDKRYAVFQTREFHGARYDMSLYFIEDTDPPVVHVGRSQCYAVSPQRVLKLMRRAGFADLQRIDDAFYQPVLVGTRRL